MEIKGVLVGCSHLKVETPRNRRKDMIEKEPIANLPISCMADDYDDRRSLHLAGFEYLRG